MRSLFSQNLALIVAGFAIESHLKSDRQTKEYIATSCTQDTRLKDLPIDCRLSHRLAVQLMGEQRGTVYKRGRDYYYSPNVQLSLFEVK